MSDGDRPYSPSELWRQRCRGGRIDVNPQHEDFPALLAEALDVLFASRRRSQSGGSLAGLFAYQLIRFLKEAPRAMTLINERRRAAGRHPSVTKRDAAGAAVLMATSVHGLPGKDSGAAIFTVRLRSGRCREGRQLLGGQLLERSSVSLQSRLESQSDFVELR